VWAGEQVSLLFDMFHSQFAPRMDFVGHVENLDSDYETLLAAFSHSKQGMDPDVKAFMRAVAKKHEGLEASVYRTKVCGPALNDTCIGWCCFLLSVEARIGFRRRVVM
jgi:hypothetical protein